MQSSTAIRQSIWGQPEAPEHPPASFWPRGSSQLPDLNCPPLPQVRNDSFFAPTGYNSGQYIPPPHPIEPYGAQAWQNSNLPNIPEPPSIATLRPGLSGEKRTSFLQALMNVGALIDETIAFEKADIIVLKRDLAIQETRVKELEKQLFIEKAKVSTVDRKLDFLFQRIRALGENSVLDKDQVDEFLGQLASELPNVSDTETCDSESEAASAGASSSHRDSSDDSEALIEELVKKTAEESLAKASKPLAPIGRPVLDANNESVYELDDGMSEHSCDVSNPNEDSTASPVTETSGGENTTRDSSDSDSSLEPFKMVTKAPKRMAVLEKKKGLPPSGEWSITFKPRKGISCVTKELVRDLREAFLPYKMLNAVLVARRTRMKILFTDGFPENAQEILKSYGTIEGTSTWWKGIIHGVPAGYPMAAIERDLSDLNGLKLAVPPRPLQIKGKAHFSAVIIITNATSSDEIESSRYACAGRMLRINKWAVEAPTPAPTPAPLHKVIIKKLPITHTTESIAEALQNDYELIPAVKPTVFADQHLHYAALVSFKDPEDAEKLVCWGYSRLGTLHRVQHFNPEPPRKAQ